VTIIPVTIAEPDVFGDYFDDGMKLVDISQDAALRSCLSDGKTADKTKAAYDGCYGQGYDFDDLAKAGGDDDGLPDELEEKEACFYKKMGWVSEDNVMDEAAIAADMEGLENRGRIQEEFLSDVGTCVAWSGNFGERRKREAGMEVQTQDTQDRELVPGLMDTGRRAMGWVKKLVRKVRSPGKGKSGKGDNCPKGPKGKECRMANRGRGKRTKGKKVNNNNNKSVGGKNKGKNNSQNGNSKGRRARKGGKVGGKGRKAGKSGRGKNARKGGRGRNAGKGGRGKNARKGGRGRNAGKGGRGKNARKDGRGRNAGKGGRGRNAGKGGKGRKARKKGKGQGKEKDKGGKDKKNDKKKRGKNGKNNKPNENPDENSKRNNKNNKEKDKSLPEAVYNKLWCIDLAIEQALEKCVEAKILN